MACLSLIANLLFAIVLFPKPKKSNNANAEYNYLSNPQYLANCTMFELTDTTADIVFVGDSITAYAHWEEFFPQENVLNRGIGSDSSEGIFNRLDEIIAREPKEIFLMIGINDLAYEIKQDTTKWYIAKIVQSCIFALPDCKIYLESVLPYETISLERICSLNHEIESVAEDTERCEFIDLYSLFINEKEEIKEDLLSADGVHLSGDGYRVWIEAIQNYIGD